MSIKEIKSGLEKKLLTLSPPIDTAFESVTYVPSSGVPYQRVQLILRSRNTTQGSTHFRQEGDFQVFLLYPSNEGTGDILTRAELLREHFKRGTTIVEGGFTINIVETPNIAGAQVIGDRVITPIIIPFVCEVF